MVLEATEWLNVWSGRWYWSNNLSVSDIFVDYFWNQADAFLDQLVWADFFLLLLLGLKRAYMN